MTRLDRKIQRAQQQTLNRLKRYPRIYSELIHKYDDSFTLGAIDWSKLGKDLLTDMKDIYQYKQISQEERKALELEIQRQELLNEQKRVELEIAERQALMTENQEMFVSDVSDRMKYAIPIVAGLGVLYLFMRKRR